MKNIKNYTKKLEINMVIWINKKIYYQKVYKKNKNILRIIINQNQLIYNRIKIIKINKYNIKKNKLNY